MARLVSATPNFPDQGLALNSTFTPRAPGLPIAHRPGRTARRSGLSRRLAGAALTGVIASTTLLGAAPAWAGRPLATDDAATAGAGTCQVESWVERGPGQHHLHLSPACGVGDAVEINGEIVRRRADGEAATDLSLGAKWVDPSWKLGPLALGLKAWSGQHRLPDGHQETGERGAAVLLSSELGASGAAHLNLGVLRDGADGKRHGLLNLAVTWKPADNWLTFAELNAVRHNPTTRSAGLRWWLRPDVLGLDLTASRSAGQAGPATLTLGLGWYGISY
jgi:hypothetical protein